MELLRWMGWMFARFVAVSVTLVSGWMFLVNLAEINHPSYQAWVLTWILASGLVGALGGVAYLMSVDGTGRFHTRAWRFGGWVAMLVAVMLPTSLSFMLIPLTLALIPSLFLGYGPSKRVTSA
ncbi:MAG TPA: hypothetical protein VJ948_06750 [Acidimicrobiia bacterium]|nr:hypothetical protein [Acidimicrobiia bacterium]